MQLQHQKAHGMGLRKITLKKWALTAGALVALPLAITAFDSSQSEAAAKGNIKWQPSLAAALKEAKRTKKPIFIDFYATWCGPCKFLDKAYNNPVLARETKNWVMLKIDNDLHRDLATWFRIESLPTMVYLDRNGKEKARRTGFAVSSNVKTEAQFVQAIAKDVTQQMQKNRRK